MSTVAYLRQSRDSDLGILRQRERCTALAARAGITLDREYVDNDVSASSDRGDTTAWHRMLVDIRRGDVEHVLCINTDRLTRQTQDLITLAATGVLITTENGPLHLLTADGLFTGVLTAALAQHEAMRKAERQRYANDQRRRAGEFFSGGVRLTGYTLKGEVIPEEARYIAEVFTRFSIGDSIASIGRWLTEAGVEPRRPPTVRSTDPGQRAVRDAAAWPPSSVHTILTNPRYAARSVMIGEKYEPGEWVPGSWEPIVDPDIFDAVQIRLADPRRKTNRVGTARKHLGAGLWQCALCGAGMDTHGKRYRCPRAGHGSRSIIPVDGYITDLISARLSRPDIVNQFPHADDVAARRLSNELGALRARRRRFEADYDAGIIEGLRYREATDKVDAEIQRVDTERLTLGIGADAAGIFGAPDPAAEFMAASVERRRLVIDLLATIKLHPNPPYSKIFRPESVEVIWKTA